MPYLKHIFHDARAEWRITNKAINNLISRNKGCCKIIYVKLAGNLLDGNMGSCLDSSHRGSACCMILRTNKGEGLK